MIDINMEKSRSETFVSLKGLEKYDARHIFEDDEEFVY